MTECIEIARRAIGEGVKISEAKLTEHVDRLIARHTRRGASDVREAVMQDLHKLDADIKVAAALAKRNALFNKRAIIQETQTLVNVWADDPAKGLRTLLHGTVAGKWLAGQSVGRAQNARADGYVAALHADLAKADLFTMFESGDLDLDIARAMRKIHDNDTVFKDIPPEAVSIARMLDRAFTHARLEANKNGSAIGPEKGFFGVRSHDHLKIRKHKERWLELMREKLDMEETFSDLPANQIDDALLDLQHDFISNAHISRRAPESTNMGLKGFGNVAKNMSHERVLKFKTPEGEVEYMKEFGSGNIAKGAFFTLQKMGRETALLQRLGPNPELNMEEIVRQTIAHYNKRDPKKTRDILNTWNKLKRDTLPQIIGTSRAVENDLLAQANSVNSVIQFTSHLGSALLSMPSDVAIVGSAFQFQGRSFLEGMGTAVTSLTRGMPKTPELRDALASLSYMSDGILGTTMMRYAENDVIQGDLATGLQYFWKFSGIQAWPDAIRRGFMLSMSNWIARSGDKGFTQLTGEMQLMFTRAGIGEDEWDNVLRHALMTPDSDVEARALFVPEAMKDMDDTRFARVLTKQGAKATPARIRALRDELHSKVQTMYQDETIFAVVEGDLETRSFGPGGGAPQGTWSNLIRSNIMMFKTFGISVVQKPIMRQIKGRPEGFGASGIVGLAQLITSMTLLGYGSMVLKDLSKNRTPRDPTDPRTVLAAFTQGGGLGLYGDFLFGQVKNRFGGGFVSSVAGPLAGDIDKFMDVFGRARAGLMGQDDQDVFANMTKLAISNTPFISLFYIRGILDYMIINEMYESMNPGYLKRVEQRMLRENEQTRLFAVQ
jgi:hypothetical protein